MLLTDSAISPEKRGPIGFQIGLSTFGILALELALIRWTSSQIRVFAYFNNLVLICSFLGMGLGVALGARHRGLVHCTLPALFVLSIPLAFSQSLHFMHMPFPDQTVALWGGEAFSGAMVQYISNLLVFILLFSLVIIVFLFAGSPVGFLFSKLPILRAYSCDLFGSLLGIVVFVMATFLNAGPPVWLCIGCLPFVWLSRKPLSLLAFAGILVLAWCSVDGAVYSSYNRIDVRACRSGLRLDVNRDFHQFIYDFSDRTMTNGTVSTEALKRLGFLRDVYDLPFQVNNARHSALIVGAGTGNDVQAALRNDYRQVYSVDIDGKIIELGKRLHPEKPYEDPRVITVVNDARAFFEQYHGKPFDVICYGLLDSHAMFSSMSSLRLDNYVYSEEGIRSAWRHVSERGHLSISFSVYAGQWIADRLYWTIAKATGTPPIAIYHGMNFGATYLVAPDMNHLRDDRLAKYPRIYPSSGETSVRTVSDDWPFLYVRPGLFPWGYVTVLATLLIIAFVSTPLAFGRKTITSDFDSVLFFMGAGFLLIETRGVTSLSLLFGSTWIVNSAIFTGILAMILLANLLVERFRLKRPLPWFFLLLLCIVPLWASDNAILNHYPLLIRGLLGGFINALPIGVAGIIVSILLSRSANPTASLGSNLLGSVLGGCLEYLSMLLGLKALALLASLFYLLASFFLSRRSGQYYNKAALMPSMPADRPI